MSLNFIKRAEQGNRSALPYIATTLMWVGGMFMLQMMVGTIATLIASEKKGESVTLNSVDAIIAQFPHPWGFAILMSTFAGLIGILWLCLRFFHQRKLSSVW